MGIVEKYIEGLKKKYLSIAPNRWKRFELTKMPTTKLEIEEVLTSQYQNIPNSFIELLRYTNGSPKIYFLGTDVGKESHLLCDINDIKASYRLVETILKRVNDSKNQELTIDERIGTNLTPNDWINFSVCLQEGRKSHLFIDLNPSKKGKVGQIVRYTREFGLLKVIANSFDEYLNMLIDNDYDFIDEELTDIEDKPNYTYYEKEVFNYIKSLENYYYYKHGMKYQTYKIDWTKPTNEYLIKSYILDTFSYVPKTLIDLLRATDGYNHRNFIPSNILEDSFYLNDSYKILSGFEKVRQIRKSMYFDNSIIIDEKINKEISLMDWINIASSSNEEVISELFIDNNPSTKGIVGQIIYFNKEKNELKVIANSLKELLENIEKSILKETHNLMNIRLNNNIEDFNIIKNKQNEKVEELELDFEEIEVEDVLDNTDEINIEEITNTPPTEESISNEIDQSKEILKEQIIINNPINIETNEDNTYTTDKEETSLEEDKEVESISEKRKPKKKKKNEKPTIQSNFIKNLFDHKKKEQEELNVEKDNNKDVKSIAEKYIHGLKEKYYKVDYSKWEEFESSRLGAHNSFIKDLIVKYPEVPKSLIDLYEYTDGSISMYFLGSDIKGYPYYFNTLLDISMGSSVLKSVFRTIDEHKENNTKIDERINKDTSKLHWLYFSDCMNNGENSRLFIDFTPSDKGQVGQVIRYSKDTNEFVVIANSFDEYLRFLIDNNYDFIGDDNEE